KAPPCCAPPSRPFGTCEPWMSRRPTIITPRKARRSKWRTRKIPTIPACGNSSTRNPTSQRSSRSASQRSINDRKRERRNRTCSFVLKDNEAACSVHAPPRLRGRDREGACNEERGGMRQDSSVQAHPLPNPPPLAGEGADRVRCSHWRPTLLLEANRWPEKGPPAWWRSPPRPLARPPVPRSTKA